MFAIVPNLSRKNAYGVTKLLCEQLEKFDMDFAMDESLKDEFHGECKNYFDEDKLYNRCEAVIAVGGDGTFIGCAKKASENGKPILGINAGRVAFMAGLEPTELELLERLKTGDYTVDKRMMLSVCTEENGVITNERNCVNDIFLGRARHVNMVNVKVICDKREITEYFADGVIVATPTGSTAYSLSAGGPVVDPLIESLIVTPVCAHSLFPRPMIFRSESVLEIENRSKSGDAFLFCDGGEGISVLNGCKVIVKKADKTADFIRIKSDSFMDILKTKMN